MASSEAPPSAEPWRPFQSRLEFEVAELALEVGLNNQKTDRLIKLCHRCIVGKEKFTFKNHKDIHIKWEAASVRITQFTKEVISVPYDGKMWDFDLHYRDLWGLASDLLGDPRIFPHFIFDAQRLFKFNRDTFVCFVDEPFTAQDFWNVQSQLPPGGKPLAFILYADKTRLSSFGTAKGYPVVAHLANLPTNIRNRRGIGSSHVVGWLPIILEDKDYAGKPSWVNFKNAVWHESFRRITASLALKLKMGQWFACMDGVSRWFFLCVLILSADYEEQCVMSLTQGIMSLWPCPICLNALWDIQYSDVHRLLSHDRWLWSHHYWVDLQKRVVRLGRAKVSQVDKSYQAFPHWQDLRHPNQVMDISKMIIYATHNILMEDESPLGYLLLRCVQLYLEVDIYTAFEVHTTGTISEGRSAVQALTAFMKQYITKTEDDDKSDKDWSFPKLHMITHLFNDIEAKGASRNYNTKPNEQMHGPLKDWYQNRTNFKNVAEQILRIDHWVHITDDIHRHISDLDDYISSTLSLFLNVFLPACNIPLPDGRRIHLKSNVAADSDANEITEYQFLRVNFESFVDWRQHTGLLADLFPLALIHPFDAPTGTRLRKDKQLNLFRAEFFSIRSILHGALLVHDAGLDYFVVDTVDTDMFLHVKEMHLQAGHVYR
ncbi:uncharacterized protein EDB91DRAFT_1237047 [Suillus paluster]|uniref:uncharacterized protein n=1 Tax=Suillus paluster TaxID=48578 RepID=UPI001B872CC2|nr:uncharacterized protein EDB91DRAFT_1237047 [Suillus paluster]KAG1741774.1 hypothetical protein EDB91DRAFT_1237047 [Suillus paluster]